MRVLIVGAGIAGLSAAWALAKRGHAVTIFEQGPLPNPLAASGDHHRIIRRAYGPGSGYGRAIDEAYAAWNELWADLNQVHYDHRGFMAVSRQAGDEADRYLAGLVAGGYPHTVLEPAKACENWPFLRKGAFDYAFHSPEGGALHCRRIASGLASWLTGNGAQVRTGTKVVSVEPHSANVVTASGEKISGDLAIVTAGAWVAKLFPFLADQLTAKRTAVVYLEPPAELKRAWDAAPVILDVGGDTDGYIIPPTGGAGLKFGSGLHKQDNPDADSERNPRDGEGAAIRDLFAPIIAGIDAYRVIDTVTCVYTFTGDERFFCHEMANTIVVSACSGHGYKFGAAVGRRVADWAENRRTRKLRSWLRAENADPAS